MKIEKTFELTLKPQLQPLSQENNINYFSENDLEGELLRNNHQIVNIQEAAIDPERENSIEQQIQKLEREKCKEECTWVTGLSLKLLSLSIGILPVLWVGVRVLDRIENHDKIEPIEAETTSLVLIVTSLIAKCSYTIFNKMQKEADYYSRRIRGRIIELKLNRSH